MSKNIKKITAIFGVVMFLSFTIISCGESSNSIAGIYKNGYFNQIEIKEDGTYIVSECEPSASNIDLLTADPNAEVPLTCKEQSRGKWTLKGNEIELPTCYPYTFGVKPRKLFYNDLIMGGGTIEYTKQ